MGMTGKCLCGAISYELNSDPLMCVACHCKNCQRQAGSALSVIIGVTVDSIAIQGEVKTYDDTGDSGAAVYRQFCPDCGSPVFTRLEGQKNMMFVKAGTLDDTSSLKPSFHCYTKSAQDWVEMGECRSLKRYLMGFEGLLE